MHGRSVFTIEHDRAWRLHTLIAGGIIRYLVFTPFLLLQQCLD
jgi:hypothetical protein